MQQSQPIENKKSEFVTELMIFASMLTPLVVATASSVFPFVFPKVIFLEIVVGICATAFIALLWRKPEYRLTKSAYVYVLLVYAAVLCASALFGFDPNRSFWSNHERMTGVVFIWFTMMLSYIVASFYSVNANKISRFLLALVIISVGGSLSGIYQAIDSNFLMGTGDRVAGVFGNPIYFGGFAAQFLMFSLYFAYRFWSQPTRWYFIAAAALHAIALYLSATRGAFIGLFAAGLFASIAWIVREWREGNRTLAKRITSSGLAFVLIVMIVSPIIARKFPDSKFARFANFSTEITTASTRFIAWDIAIKGFKEEPLLGWGPENYYYVFNKHFNPKSAQYGTYETWFDHAHNSVFDVLVTQGILGIVVYLLQYIIVWWMILKTTIVNKKDWVLSVVLAAFFVLHFVHNLFVFDHPGSYVVFYLIAGIVAARYLAAKTPVEKTTTVAPYAMGLIAVQAGALALTGFVTIPSIRQNSLDYQAQHAASLSLVLSKKYFEQAIAIRGPHTADVLLDVGRLAQRIPPSAIKANSEFFTFAVNSVDELLKSYEPANVLAALVLGQLLTNAVEAGDPQAAQKGDAVFQYAVSLSPRRVQLYHAWSRLKIVSGRSDEAIALIRKTIKDEPEVAQSRWYLAILLVDKEPKLALDELRQAERLGFQLDAPQNRFVVAEIYRRNNLMDDAVYYYELIIKDGGFRSWDKTTVLAVDSIAKQTKRPEIQTALRTQFPEYFGLKK